MSTKDWNKTLTLRDYVLTLLRDGKRANHPDFGPLFMVYGRDKIVDMAKELLAEERAKSEKEIQDGASS